MKTQCRANCEVLKEELLKLLETSSSNQQQQADDDENDVGDVEKTKKKTFLQYFVAEWLTDTAKETQFGISRFMRWAGCGRPKGTVINTSMKVQFIYFMFFYYLARRR